MFCTRSHMSLQRKSSMKTVKKIVAHRSNWDPQGLRPRLNSPTLSVIHRLSLEVIIESN